MRKETTYTESNLQVVATYEATEILPLDKVFKLVEGMPIGLTLKSDTVDIHITLMDVTHFPKRFGNEFVVSGQIIAKFTEREPTE